MKKNNFKLRSNFCVIGQSKKRKKRRFWALMKIMIKTQQSTAKVEGGGDGFCSFPCALSQGMVLNLVHSASFPHSPMPPSLPRIASLPFCDAELLLSSMSQEEHSCTKNLQQIKLFMSTWIQPFFLQSQQ